MDLPSLAFLYVRTGQPVSAVCSKAGWLRLSAGLAFLVKGRKRGDQSAYGPLGIFAEAFEKIVVRIHGERTFEERRGG